jgi:hypothetical protein
MKNSPHLYITDLPIVACLDIEALCGEVISNPQICLAWDELVIGGPLDLTATKFCTKCKKAFIGLPWEEKRVNVFGIMAGGSDAA